jgi:hypothetical protein
MRALLILKNLFPKTENICCQQTQESDGRRWAIAIKKGKKSKPKLILEHVSIATTT